MKAFILSLLCLFSSYCTLGVDPPDDNPDDTPPDDSNPADHLPDDTPPDDTPPDDTPPDDSPDARVAAAVSRAEKAERAAAEERAAREALERTHRAPAPQQHQDPARAEWEAEEAKLRNPNTSALEKWQIESSRTLRATRADAAAARQEAVVAADNAEFADLVRNNPLAKKYAKRVEEKQAEFLGKGQFVPKKIALKMLIGDDIVEGRVTRTPRKAAAADAPRTVDRGRTVSPRSDTRRGGPATESEKRRQRLATTII